MNVLIDRNNVDERPSEFVDGYMHMLYQLHYNDWMATTKYNRRLFCFLLGNSSDALHILLDQHRTNLLRHIWFGFTEERRRKLIATELPRLYALCVIFEDAKVWQSLPPMTKQSQYRLFRAVYWVSNVTERFYFFDFERVYTKDVKRYEENEIVSQLRPIVCALYPLQLPTYILLWICDWLPEFFERASQYAKVKAIESVQQCCDAIVRKRK
jgi:hypothetical protein